MMPTPAPNTSRPRALAQPLTGSVAMKKAPMIKAPENTCCSGAGLLPGSASQAMVPSASTLPIIAMGACQLMMRRQSNQTPPTAYQFAIHSQPIPPKSPKTGAWRASDIMLPDATLVLMVSRGVASVIASQDNPAGGLPLRMVISVSPRPRLLPAIDSGGSQAVMACGKLINTTT